jgi:YggT family protein
VVRDGWSADSYAGLPEHQHAAQLSGVTFVITGIDAVLGVLRASFFWVAAALAVICAVDWAVRSRRISPFSGVARFVRGSIDPLMSPVERRIVRAGGVPSSAPWWTLVAVVLAGIVVISGLGFVRDQLAMAFVAMSAGPGGLYRLLVTWTFAILQLALVIRVVCSWVRISPYSKWVRWAFVLTEPMLRPLRQIIPSIGMIDVTPLVAYFLLWLLKGFLLRLA